MTSPMSGYPGQLKGARFTKKMGCWFAIEIRPRQLDVGISCLNNDLVRH